MALVPSLVPDADIKTLAAAHAKLLTESSMPPYWDLLVSQCNTQALAEITDRLVNRGFSIAQISAWDRLTETNRDLGVYFVLVKVAALEVYDLAAVKMLDRRVWLETVMVTCNGIWQSPGGPVQTQEASLPPINFGAQSSGADLFSLDPSDTRAGTPTQF